MAGGQFVSISWALKSALAALDDDYDYDFINGITGGAFMIQSSDKEDCKAWWTTGNQTCFLDFVAKVFGLELSLLPGNFRYPQDLEGVEDPWEFFQQNMQQEVLNSLENGVPVIAQGVFEGFKAGQWSVIAGFEEGLPVGQAAWGQGYEVSQTPPWRAVIISESGLDKMDPKQAVRQAIVNAVQLNNNLSPNEPDWSTGQKSWQEVIEGLKSEFYCQACGPESGSCLHWTASYIAGARVSAVHFLDMAGEILEITSEALGRAMASYAAVVEALRPYTVVEQAFKALENNRDELVQAFTAAKDADAAGAGALEELAESWSL